MADEENNSEEAAKETTLQHVVEKLCESNEWSQSIAGVALATGQHAKEINEVLTSIANILQGQLDLSKREQLDAGRDLSVPDEDDESKNTPFQKLEMPTTVEDGLALAIGILGNASLGFITEIKTMLRGETKKINKMKPQLLEAPKGIRNSIKGFRLAINMNLAMYADSFNKALKADIKRFNLKKLDASFTKLKTNISSFKTTIIKGITDISTKFNNYIKSFNDIFKSMKMSMPTFGGGKIDKFVKKFMDIMKSIRAFGQGFGRFMAKALWPITLIVGVYDGIMKMFEEAEKEEGVIAKGVAGIFGFITGMVNYVIAEWFDILKSFLSWTVEKIFGDENPFSKMLDSFSFSELFLEGMQLIKEWFMSIPKYFTDAWNRNGMRDMTSFLMTLIGDFFGFIGNLLGFLGEVVLGGLIDWFGEKMGFLNLGTNFITVIKDWWTEVVEAIKEKFDDATKYIKNLFGIDDTPEAIPMVNQQSEGQDKAQGTAQGNDDDAFYEKSYYGESSINKANIPMASEKQLQEIVDDNDLTEEDMMFVKTVLAVKQEEASDDPMLAAIKTVAKTSTPEEAAQAKVNAAASKKKRDEFLASIPPEELAALKAEMGISKPDTSRTYAGSVGATDLDTVSPEEQSAYDEFKKIPEGVRRAEPHIQQQRTNPFSMGLKSRVETRKELRSYQANPLIEAPREGSAVNQGQALGNKTNDMADAKSRQQSGGSPVVISNPNNSQVTNNSSSVTQAIQPASSDSTDRTFRSSPMKR